MFICWAGIPPRILDAIKKLLIEELIPTAIVEVEEKGFPILTRFPAACLE